MCRYAYGLYVMKDILFTHDGFQNNYYNIITRGSSFQFDENDIDRMRMELMSLISALSPVYLESISSNGHYLFGSGFFGFWVLEKKEFPRTLCYKVF
jgi:hypothetical protein